MTIARKADAYVQNIVLFAQWQKRRGNYMPYIKKDGRREALQREESALTAGELNYQIFYYLKHTKDSHVFQIIKVQEFIKNFLGDKPNYQRYNDMTGCLIRCYKEIQRRLNIDAKFLMDIMNSYDYEIDNYEDEKYQINGDVE
jgi:hypothetical protein